MAVTAVWTPSLPDWIPWGRFPNLSVLHFLPPPSDGAEICVAGWL